MTEEQATLLAKAHASLSAARLLLDSGYADFAVSRAYYAMFYAAEALLDSKGLAYSRHSAVIAAFGKEFCLTGDLPLDFHRRLIDAEDARHSGDYGSPNSISAEECWLHLESAEEFVAVVGHRLSATSTPGE